jgi:hypothetical protein
MMGHYLTNGAPAWAITAWVDDNFVYTQIPSTKGEPPYIQKYPLTSTGLGEALALMREIYRERHPPGKGRDFISRTATKIAPQVKGRPAKPLLGTPEQREATRQILKKLGIL